MTPVNPTDTAETGEHLAKGVVLNSDGQMLTLSLPGSDYQLHLACDQLVETTPEATVSGRIYARARRVDNVSTGGRFIEPVYGRPRRLQGTVVQTDRASNSIVIQCGCPFICELVTDQRATDFAVGALVAFDIERGARFQLGPDHADNPL